MTTSYESERVHTEDPDGIPHVVIGLTALFSVALAVALVIMLSSGGNRLTAVFAFIVIPVLVSKLGRKAERERDHVTART